MNLFKPKHLVYCCLKQCAGATHVFTRPNGWLDLESNRYVHEKARLVNFINQKY